MEQYLVHHGIKGQKWGVRRYQNTDGSLTAAGKIRYSSDSPDSDTFWDREHKRREYEDAVYKKNYNDSMRRTWIGQLDARRNAGLNKADTRMVTFGTLASAKEEYNFKQKKQRAQQDLKDRRDRDTKAPGSENANSYYNKDDYRAKPYKEAEKRDNKKNYGLSKPGEPNRQAPASDSLQNDRLRNQQREQLWDTKQNTVRNRKADTKLPGSETMPRGNQPDYRVGYGTQSYQKGPYETVEYDEYRMVDAKTGESVSAWDEDILKSKVNKDVWANAGIPWSANSKTLDNYITQFADRMESNRNSARYNNSADNWNAARKAAQTVSKNSSTTLDKIGSAVNSAVKAGTDWLKKVIGKK